MSIGPIRLQAESGLKLVSGLLRDTFVFESECQVVMGQGIVRFEFESHLVICDSFVPRFSARQLDSPLAVKLGGLRQGRFRERQAENQDKCHGR